MSSSLPSIPIVFLKAGEKSALSSTAVDSQSTLKDLLAGKIGVIDFWHTKCTRCPAAIEKLNGQAAGFGNEEEVVFVTCALSQGGSDLDTVKDVVEEDAWSALNHIFVEEKDKDACKATFGYTAVPFYVVFDHNGNIYRAGEPKSIDLLADLKQLLQNKNQPAYSAPAASGGLTFDEDF